MKHFVKTSVATAVVMGTALIAGSAFAGIANTKHNMGGGGPNTTGGTGEICVFCHTPHGADTGAPVPLWNKQLTTATFATYDQLGTSTLDGAVQVIDQGVGSVSLACLTCHDGTQAMDNIINAPGSGGYDATGGGANGLTGASWDWTSTDSTVNTEGTFINGVDGGGTNIWNIGTDLTNDHPVSMQYAGGGYSFTTQDAFGATRDLDFAQATAIGTAGRWYVDNPDAGTVGSFDKWDFKLYTRDTDTWGDNPNNGASFAGEKEPFIECGSCHDPHFETTTFLRMPGDISGSPTASNDGSAVCLACHTK